MSRSNIALPHGTVRGKSPTLEDSSVRGTDVAKRLRMLGQFNPSFAGQVIRALVLEEGGVVKTEEHFLH